MPLLPKSLSSRLPAWVDAQGGRASWAKWVKTRAGSCHRRAKKWKKKTEQALTLPAKHEWTTATIEALEACGGVAVYSRWWKLDVALPSTSPLYPSINHVAGLGTAKAVVETRLVNGTKTILDEAEFKLVIAHLASTLGVSAAALATDWKPRRTFGGPQGPEEPAL